MMIATSKRAFSLIEMLLAIFILGIGIISIATLFPAGIAQQQKSSDDVIGSIIARNAMTLIRSRVTQDDFGGSEQFDSRWSPELCGFNVTDGSINQWPTICGDWMWRRPGIITNGFGNDDTVEDVNLRGAIDLFALRVPDPSGIGTSDVLVEDWTDEVGVPGLPYNKEKYPDLYDDNGSYIGLDPPIKRILAGERQYPMWYGAEADRPEAQYHWDCMFRRYEGRILVAIFVYRVVDPSQTGRFVVDTTGFTSPNWPRWVDLQSQSSTGAWHAVNGAESLSGSELDDPIDPNAQWQFPGQWIVDQNGNVHTVQRGRRRANDDALVRLAAAPAELPVFEAVQGSGNPGVNVNWWDKTFPQAPNSGFIQYGVVTDIWFMPTSDAQGRKIVPVYATVQEL